MRLKKLKKLSDKELYYIVNTTDNIKERDEAFNILFERDQKSKDK